MSTFSDPWSVQVSGHLNYRSKIFMRDVGRHTSLVHLCYYSKYYYFRYDHDIVTGEGGGWGANNVIYSQLSIRHQGSQSYSRLFFFTLNIDIVSTQHPSPLKQIWILRNGLIISKKATEEKMRSPYHKYENKRQCGGDDSVNTTISFMTYMGECDCPL